MIGAVRPTALALFAAATAAVLWSGLNLPPLALLLRYGSPGGDPRTGRTARIPGVELVGPESVFREYKPGYAYVDAHAFRAADRVIVRLPRVLSAEAGEHPCRPGCLSVPPPAWREVPEPFWLADSRVNHRWWAADRSLEDGCRRLAAATGLPFRFPRSAEAWLAGLWPEESIGPCEDGWMPPHLSLQDGRPLGSWSNLGFRPTLTSSPSLALPGIESSGGD